MKQYKALGYCNKTKNNVNVIVYASNIELAKQYADDYAYNNNITLIDFIYEVAT